MIQPYDLVTALDLNGLMLFFWFTLLFDLPRYIISAIAMACVPWHSPRRLRFAPDAIARTIAPETLVSLLLQRLRWDSSIITIWWGKHARNLNPFGQHFSFANMWTNLDVLWFSAILPLVLPVYVLWLYNSVGDVSITFLLTVFLGLCALDIILCVVTCVPLRF